MSPAQTMAPDADYGSKEDSPHAILEKAHVAFDPSTQHLDLNKYEKRRTTALLMATQAYRELIIKDAEMTSRNARSLGLEIHA